MFEQVFHRCPNCRSEIRLRLSDEDEINHAKGAAVLACALGMVAILFGVTSAHPHAALVLAAAASFYFGSRS